MLRIVHEFLRWLPASVGGSAIAIAAVWPAARDWIGTQTVLAWAQVTEPWKACAAILVIALYVLALLRTAREEGPKPKFLLAFSQIAFNGIPNGTPPRYGVIAVVNVRNIGTVPSSLHQWRMVIRGNGKEELLKITHTEALSLTSLHGSSVSFGGSDGIFNKTINPVPPGGLVVGFLMGTSHNDWIGQLTVEHVLSVSCSDVFGNACQVSRRMESESDPELLRYPGLDTQKVRNAIDR